MPVKLYIDLIADLFVFRILSYEEQQCGGTKKQKILNMNKKSRVDNC